MPGGVVFEGGAGWMTGVGGEVADAVPPPGSEALEAVTATRRVVPTSEEPRLYVDPVAPARGLHPRPDVSQRSHWYV
jgi:hypothetical protein